MANEPTLTSIYGAQREHYMRISDAEDALKALTTAQRALQAELERQSSITRLLAVLGLLIGAVNFVLVTVFLSVVLPALVRL